MATINISHLDELTLAQLRRQASNHGHTVKAETVDLLKGSIKENGKQDSLWRRIRRRVEPYGGFELPEFKRELSTREPPSFD